MARRTRAYSSWCLKWCWSRFRSSVSGSSASAAGTWRTPMIAGGLPTSSSRIFVARALPAPHERCAAAGGAMINPLLDEPNGQGRVQGEMSVFIVHAHPEPRSFNGAMTRAAAAALKEAGHELAVSDLYAMGFDPVSDRHNFTTVNDPDTTASRPRRPM